VVDDSAFMRYTIAKHLEADPELTVVGSARDGLDALQKISALTPDVITLDVEMPRMDGLTTLQRVMTSHPTPVIMLSSLTQRGARTTIQALMRGAVDFVPKPAASADMRVTVESLIEKIKAAAGVQVQAKREPAPIAAQPALAVAALPAPAAKMGLRPFKMGDPVIVIGASTGGPRALQQVLADLPADLPAAVAVVQHMPPGFTRSLAQRLNEHCALTVQEAVDGDRLAQGLVLLAPGDFHLRFKDGKQVMLDQGPRRRHVRPAVDVLMESAAEHHKTAVIGVVLTGMGADGSAGAGAIKAAGGRVISEDESTCVVYGMPRSVVEAGFTDRVAPLPEIASVLVQMVKNGNVGI
jgi:two-component system chemotaxis response regulator CheB